MIGNALGDGSAPKKDTNSTEEAKDERTFSQKYKDQLKKDINDEEDDDLGPDDEVVEGGETTSTGDATPSDGGQAEETK
jgi:hypothetical protein